MITPNAVLDFTLKATPNLPLIGSGKKNNLDKTVSFKKNSLNADLLGLTSTPNAPDRSENHFYKRSKSKSSISPPLKRVLKKVIN